MHILVVSGDGSANDFCVRLGRDGHSVKLYTEDAKRKRDLRGMVRRVSNWEKELAWVGKEGLIIFDTTGFGKIQDKLRKRGYSVVGSSEMGDRCEDDRAYGQKVLLAYGVKVVPSMDFFSIYDAIAFVEKYPSEWVIKQNGHASKTFNYVGEFSDGSDVISVLRHYKKTIRKSDLRSIELQKRVRGIEIGVARYFNGKDWVGPIEINLEHKNLCNDGLGPKTFEMGTLMWFDDNENGKLFQETLAKIKPYLEKIKFHGDVDINCIVNEEGVFPLEFTARLGFPALQLQQTLSKGTAWGEYLKAVADGQQYDFKYERGEYGVVVLVALPPFPYADTFKDAPALNLDILFREELSLEEFDRIHFEGVSKRKDGAYFVSTETGFALHVSGAGKTVEAARKQAYSLVEKIIIPKKFYRTDIGQMFIDKDWKQLKEIGWLS